jgi:serine/threonine protein kinase
MQSDIAVTSARDLSGTTIGRFAIQELLGKGGMGEVYRASDLRLKRQVALKRIAPHLRGDKRSRERLWKEAEWASRLSDPHIAAVHDVIEEENELFIVMEYVRGLQLSPPDQFLLYQGALVYNQFGQSDEAIDWLNNALAAGYSPSRIRDFPNFDDLRAKPQFQELLRAKMN